MLILKLLFFLALGFMKNKILYFDSSEGASAGNTSSKSFSFLLNYVNLLGQLSITKILKILMRSSTYPLRHMKQN